MARPNAKKHLHELVDEFEVAMLVTRTRDGKLRSRPMAIASHEDQETLCFVTDVETSKIGEIGVDQDVGVTMQSAMKYVSVSGKARIVRDHDRIARLWTEAWRPWFPKGPKDTDLVLIEVTPKEAEYWDQTGPKGLRYFVDLARKAVMGEKKRDESEIHGHVDL